MQIDIIYVLLGCTTILGAITFFQNLKIISLNKEIERSKFLIKDIRKAEHDSRHRLYEINKVLLSRGGLKKRISENLNIANSIHKLAPDIFKQDRSLIYELDANQQFLECLFEASSKLHHEWFSDDFLSIKHDVARLVFSRVYRETGMPRPSDSIAI